MKELAKILNKNLVSELTVDLSENGTFHLEKFMSALVRNTSVKRLLIKGTNSNWHLDSQTIFLSMLSKALRKNKTVNDLVVENIHVDDDAAYQFSKLLMKNAFITTLLLSSMNFNTEQYRMILGAIGENNVIKRIRIIGSEISDGDMVVRLLREATMLSSLILERVQMSKEVLNEMFGELIKNSTLENLLLISIAIEDVSVLCEVLKHNKTLDMLQLNNNHLGVENCKLIAESLQHNESLTWFTIPNNEIGAEGCKVIAEAVGNSSMITFLDVSGNDIGTEGFIAVSHALEKSPSLTMLALNGNNTELPGIFALSNALKRDEKITHLYVGSVKFTDVSLNMLAEGIIANHSLTTLRIDPDSDELYKTVTNIIRYNTSIEKLVLGARMTGNSFPEIINALKYNSTMIDISATSVMSRFVKPINDILDRNRRNREMKNQELFTLLLNRL